MSRLRACWVSQDSCRVGGDAQDVHPAGGVLDDEEGVEPMQGDGVEVEQVAGEDAVGLRLEKLRPRRPGSSGAGPATRHRHRRSRHVKGFWAGAGASEVGPAQ